MHKITDSIPTTLVQIGGLYVGKEVFIKGEYYKNRLWVQDSGGGGGFIPLPKVEKLIADEFLKVF